VVGWLGGVMEGWTTWQVLRGELGEAETERPRAARLNSASTWRDAAIGRTARSRLNANASGTTVDDAGSHHVARILVSQSSKSSQ
jgi:hypothetical protein